MAKKQRKYNMPDGKRRQPSHNLRIVPSQVMLTGDALDACRMEHASSGAWFIFLQDNINSTAF